MDREGLMYPIHIVAIRAKDVDLDRKLSILIKNGADIKHKYGANGLTGEITRFKVGGQKTHGQQNAFNVGAINFCRILN